MLPALTNRGIEIFKMSTLASAVAYVELLQQGKLIASLNFNPIEAYTAVAVDLLRLPLAAGAGDLPAGAAAAEGRMTLLKVEGLAKRFGATDVLRGIDLDVARASASPSSAPRARARARCCAASTSWRCRTPAPSSCWQAIGRRPARPIRPAHSRAS